MQQHTHKQPFVHLAYRKIMIDYLPLRDLTRAIKAAAVVLGTPVRAFYSGMAKDRQGRLRDLPHGEWHELKEGQQAKERFFPHLSAEESTEICPEQDEWDRLGLLQ